MFLTIYGIINMKKTIILSMCLTFIMGIASISFAAGADGLPRVTQELVAPPFLPKHDQVAKGGPKVVQIRLVVDQKEMQVAPDAWVQAMTFNGSVPGPMIVVHQNDYVELTLVNPSTNTFLHNIDFHASSGALGGGELTKVGPGQEVVFRFKATKPGVFCLSLCTWKHDDSLSCGFRNERCHYGPSA